MVSISVHPMWESDMVDENKISAEYQHRRSIDNGTNTPARYQLVLAS